MSASVYESPNSPTSSTPTLVEPPRPYSFIFSRSSVINATLYLCSRPVYKIKSTDTLSRTDLFDLKEQKIVASIKRRQVLADVVVFPHRNNKPVRISKWLQRPKLIPPGQTPYNHLETLSGRYVWRSERAGSHRFALYFEGQDDSPPIAYSRSIHSDPPMMGLILMHGFDDILVEIVTSFLVLENQFRMDKKPEYREMIHTAVGGFLVVVR